MSAPTVSGEPPGPRWTLPRIGAALAALLVLGLVATLVARAPGGVSDRPPVARPATTAGDPPAVMPDSTNTGVPAGTVLTDYTGPLVLDAPGTVIDARTIRGNLVIAAPDVRITRSHVLGTVSNELPSSSFTIADSTVDAGPLMVTGIGSVNFVATRVHVTGGNRSILCGSDCVVEYSYVHGQATDSSGVAHESGIRMSRRGVIRFNTIACDAPDVPPDAGCSAALTGYGDFEPVQDNLVQGNLFRHGSGGFCAYGGSSGADGSKPFGAEASGIRFVDNVWERGTRPGDHGDPVCGHWGPITDFDLDRPGNVWSGNTWDDGRPLNP